MAKPSPTSSLSKAPTVQVSLCSHSLLPSFLDSLLLLSSSLTHLSNKLSFSRCILSLFTGTTSIALYQSSSSPPHFKVWLHMQAFLFSCLSCILTHILCCSHHLAIQILLKESSIEIPRVTYIFVCLSVCLSVSQLPCALTGKE